MNNNWFRRLGEVQGVLYAALAALVAVGACGSAGGIDDPDAGVGAKSARLIVLDPPGDSIGLPFGGMATLRVRYESEDGLPLVGAEVSFGLVVGVEEASGGATLSATTVLTNGAGIASTELAAGSEPVMFRVAANAPNAPPGTFYVGVSAAGFANLVITPRHLGFRDPAIFARVELRMYRSTALTCAQASVEELPESPFPPRTASGFDAPMSYANVTVGTGYTLIAWAVGSLSETPLSVGCADLGTAYLPPSTVDFTLPVRDRTPYLPAMSIKSVFDFSPVFDAGGRSWAWNQLGCPQGPGQLLFDCVADALGNDGVLDCVPEIVPSPLDGAVRGAPDASGCRPAFVGTSRTIDSELSLALASGIAASAAEFGAISDGRRLLVANVGLVSEIGPVGAGGAGIGHGLKTAVFELGGVSAALELPSVMRPVLSVGGISYQASGNVANLGAHGFTLRPDDLLRSAFSVLVLTAYGFENDLDTFGSTLFTGVTDASSSTSGCAAVSQVICRHVESAASCVSATCAAAAAALDDQFSKAFSAVTPTGIDLTLTGEGPLYDGDEDLLADRFGSDKPGAARGNWSALVPPATLITGTFHSESLAAGGN